MSDSDPRDYRSLGDLLRDARTERKLTLEAVNQSTRISVRVIEALEKDDLEAASGAIYARGFVRTLAGYYDLDPEWLGAKLDALAGETTRPVLPVDNSDGVIAGPVDTVVEKSPKVEAVPKWEVESTRVRKVGAASSPKVPRNLVWGLLTVLLVAILLVWFLGRSETGGGTPGEAVTVAQTDEDAADQLTEQTPASDDGDAVADEEVAVPATHKDVQQNPPAKTPEKTPEKAPAKTPAGDAGPVQAKGSRNDPAQLARTTRDEANDVGPDPPAPAEEHVEERPANPGSGLPSVVRPSTLPRGAEMEIKVVASGPVEVTLSADGGRSETRRLISGQVWTMTGTDHFSLAVSDPAAMRLEMDDRARSLPADWSGAEWIVYPRPAPVDRGGND